MILIIDNYDSFSYNLFQYIGELNPDILVIRNDEKTVDEIAALNPSHIVISPGPGRPEDAGVSIDAVRALGKSVPILGVCLGHQAICAAFGATITYGNNSCTARRPKLNSTSRRPCFRERRPSRPSRDIIRSRRIRIRVPKCLRLRRVLMTAKSWRFSTKRIRSSAFSSIRNRSSPRTARRCSPTS